MDAQDAELLVSTRAAGEEYSASFSVDARRSEGRVYTPQPLVDFVLDLAEFDGGRGTLLDPACGTGFFLLGAVNRLAAHYRQGRWTSAKRRSFLAAVEERVFGVDIDPDACRIACESVRHFVSRLLGEAPVKPSFFSENIQTADFLLPGPGAVSAVSYDFVVGNPPYVQTTQLSSDHKDRLRERFRSASGRIDLYGLFMEAGLNRLLDGGRLAFVTPNKYLLSATARPLRIFVLEQSALRTIANFDSHKVFRGAATVPCVTVVEKGGNAGEVRILDCDAGGNSSRVQVRASASVESAEFSAEPWFGVLSPKLREIAARLRTRGPALLDLSERISAGIATGRDGVFVVGADVASRLEPELLHPAVRGRDIQRAGISDSRRMIILPYDVASDRPALLPLSRYPRTYRYLRQHYEVLAARHCVRAWQKKWYDIHDPVSFDLAGTPKVLVPDVAASSRFCVDEGGTVPLHSAYYIVPREIDPHFLAAMLNSEPLEFLIRLEAPVVKDGFSRYRKQFLATLPIPRLDDVDERAIATEARRDPTGAVLKDLTARVWDLASTDLDLMRDFLSSRAYSGQREGC